MTFAALSTAEKIRLRGPLLRVDHTPGQTCDFCMADGKGIAPARWHYSARGGYPEKACKRRSLGHRDRIRRVMGDMTDFDKSLPRLDGKVKR